MKVGYRKINIKDINLQDIYSICSDAIRNDSKLFNKNGKAKLRYSGLIKTLQKLNMPISKLQASMNEQDLDKILKEFDKVVRKVSGLRPSMKVQQLREGQTDYLLVEDDERGQNISDLRAAYSVAKINERNDIKQKEEHYENIEKPKEIRERMENARENSRKRREGKEFKQWIVETAKNSGEIEKGTEEKFAEKVTGRGNIENQEER